MAYATTFDVANRWRPLTAAETSRAQYLLDAASRRMRELAPTIDDRIDDGDLDPDTAADICCDMVIRVMARGVNAAQRVTVGQVTADYGARQGKLGLYLTAAELHRLVPTARAASSVSLATPDPA